MEGIRKCNVLIRSVGELPGQAAAQLESDGRCAWSLNSSSPDSRHRPSGASTAHCKHGSIGYHLLFSQAPHTPDCKTWGLFGCSVFTLIRTLITYPRRVSQLIVLEYLVSDIAEGKKDEQQD